MMADYGLISSLKHIEVLDDNNSSTDGFEHTEDAGTNELHIVSKDLPYEIWLSETDNYIQSCSKIKHDYAKTNERYKRFLAADYLARITIEENPDEFHNKRGRRVRLSTGMSISVDSVISAGDGVQPIETTQDPLENVFLPEVSSLRNVPYPHLGDGENRIESAYVDDIKTVGYGRKEILLCPSYNNSFDPRLTFQGLHNIFRGQGDAQPALSTEDLAQNVFLAFDDPDSILDKYINEYRSFLQDLNEKQNSDCVSTAKTLKPSLIDIPVDDDGTKECRRLFRRIKSDSVKGLWSSTETTEPITYCSILKDSSRDDTCKKIRREDVQDSKEKRVDQQTAPEISTNSKTKVNTVVEEKLQRMVTKGIEKDEEYHNQITVDCGSKERTEWLSNCSQAQNSHTGVNTEPTEHVPETYNDHVTKIDTLTTQNIPQNDYLNKMKNEHLIALEDTRKWPSLTTCNGQLTNEDRNNTDDDKTDHTKELVSWAKLFKNDAKDPHNTIKTTTVSNKGYDTRVGLGETTATVQSVALKSSLCPTTKPFQPSSAKEPQNYTHQTTFSFTPEQQTEWSTKTNLGQQYFQNPTRNLTAEAPSRFSNDPRNDGFLTTRPIQMQNVIPYDRLTNQYNDTWMRVLPNVNTLREDQAQHDMYNKQTTQMSNWFQDVGNMTLGNNIQHNGNNYQNNGNRPIFQNNQSNVAPPPGFSHVISDKVRMNYPPPQQLQQHSNQLDPPHQSYPTQQSRFYDQQQPVPPFQLGFMPNTVNTISKPRYSLQRHSTQTPIHPQQQQPRHQLQHQQHPFPGSQQHQYNQYNQQQLLTPSLQRFPFPGTSNSHVAPTVIRAANWTFNLNNNYNLNNNNNCDKIKSENSGTARHCSAENIPSIVHSEQRRDAVGKDKSKTAKHRTNRSNLVRIYPKNDT